MDFREKKFRRHIEEELRRQLPLPLPVPAMDRDMPIEVLRELLEYDPETGALTWKERDVVYFRSERSCNSWNAQNAGRQAFTASDVHGYKVGSIFGSLYKAHRVSWALTHGKWPSDQIDHINGIRSDNRIINLRVVTNTENTRNRKLTKTNSSGATGVYWNKKAGKWQARISADGKYKSLGYFLSLDEASAVRKAAEREHGYHENHGRVVDETSSHQK
jgi:hypothetical protein